jgi:nitrogen-specific signal transduction histidine kinase
MFNSKITLNFKDKYYETKFIEDKSRFRAKYNIILSILLSCISLSISISMILNYSELKEQFTLNYLAIMNFVVVFLNIIITLLCILIKDKKIQKILTYLNYMMILLDFCLMRFYLLLYIQIDLVICDLLIFVEMIFRLIWFVLGLIDFVPGVYLQVLSIILNFSLFAVLIPMKFYYRFSLYFCILLIISGLSYFLTLEHKRSFYYNLSLKLKNEWYESIIDNMNSGFISIKSNEVLYCNKTLLSYLKKRREENVKLKSTDIYDLFDNIMYEDNKLNTFKEVANILHKKFNEIGDNFVFLGTKDIEITPSCFIHLEVFGRCYNSYQTFLDCEYDFIFNDITRSKQIEQKNAEFKYKTLFLSKVAHEFKNPLLCISELVDQVGDNLKAIKVSNIENSILDILKQIKSMSNYLIILVKDMDYFSQKNSEKVIKKEIEMDKVNVTEMIIFCTDIVHALIKKSHKEQNLSFGVIKEDNLPSYITTDEIKLKQVLINLLSNAVKYTYSGPIFLRLALKDNSLKFQVDDTGKGITDEQKAKLFTPFSNEFDKLNKISSGLGLSIVKELVELLGSSIEFESTVAKGSSFWFFLKLGEDALTNSPLSNVTHLAIHYNTQAIKSRLCCPNSIEPKYNVIVVDDEVMIRQATIRLLYRSCKEKGINLNILEASDGIECLSIHYNHVKDGKSISFILSDETMVYMNGSYSAQILDNISKNKNILRVPFYILSAYENVTLNEAKGAIDNIFTKPLRKQYIEEIFEIFSKP